jgi:ParB/RepB/Spo0J family partition protein
MSMNIPFAENPDLIVDIPLSLIEVDYSWNSRSGEWDQDSGDEECSQLTDLIESISQDGQKTPCRVTIQLEGAKPYKLRSGFRRYRASEELGKAHPNQVPTLRCIVTREDEVEGRIENLRENAARDNVKPADLAWGIKDLQKRAKDAGTPLSGNAISKKLGLNQSYTAKLIRIGEKTKANVFARWRSTPVRISVNDMAAISELPKDQQEAAFADLLGVDVSGEGGEEVTVERDWTLAAKKAGCKLATVLARLEFDELINCDGLDFDTHLEYLVKLPKKSTANQRRSVAAALRKQYEAAKGEAAEENEAEDELPEDESDDVKPRKRK